MKRYKRNINTNTPAANTYSPNAHYVARDGTHSSTCLSIINYSIWVKLLSRKPFVGKIFPNWKEMDPLNSWFLKIVKQHLCKYFKLQNLTSPNSRFDCLLKWFIHKTNKIMNKIASKATRKITTSNNGGNYWISIFQFQIRQVVSSKCWIVE